jgi:hypothetical protein
MPHSFSAISEKKRWGMATRMPAPSPATTSRAQSCLGLPGTLGLKAMRQHGSLEVHHGDPAPAVANNCRSQEGIVCMHIQLAVLSTRLIHMGPGDTFRMPPEAASAPVFTSQPHAPRCVIRTSISSASFTVFRLGFFESSATNPTPHASLSFSGLNSPRGSGTAECLATTCMPGIQRDYAKHTPDCCHHACPGNCRRACKGPDWQPRDPVFLA